MRRILALLAALLPLTCSCPAPAVAAGPWSYDDLDHVLGRYVSEAGLVDYEGLKRDAGRLERFVGALAVVSPDSDPGLFATEADRLAYWINAYNALMLARVVRAWPIGSVREIRPLYGVFWMERHRLGGRSLSLRKLENAIIRERFGDPRIHFAINCASAGCPALPRRAWRPETLDDDLEQAARRFVRDPSNVAIDDGARRVRLSEIFKWFDEDFTGWLDRQGIAHPRGIVDYVARYLPEGRLVGEWRVEWIDYDWSINARPAPG